MPVKVHSWVHYIRVHPHSVASCTYHDQVLHPIDSTETVLHDRAWVLAVFIFSFSSEAVSHTLDFVPLTGLSEEGDLCDNGPGSVYHQRRSGSSCPLQVTVKPGLIYISSVERQERSSLFDMQF